ncbi:MAG: TIGR00730 family Rossman fold protein [Clostridia bacterium]|nr:TIGR00730 family Rossman fold protein [Clostridia bacterium]
MLKSITVFAGSAENCPEIYKQAAENLGRAIALQGRELVYGSGYSGLMGSVARGAKAAGGRIVGINVRRFEDYPPLPGTDELLMMETLPERKAALIDRGEACIAVPGGVGTLDELMDVYALVQAGILKKPLGLLNVNGYFDGLLAQLRRAHRDGFVNDRDFRRLIAVDDPETLLRLLDEEAK